MANQPTPNDPYDPYRSGLSDDSFGTRSRFDAELQPGPELEEGPSGGKIALFAVAIALVLGAVFYGLNNSSVQQAQTSEPKSLADSQPARPQVPPGMRDVTPKAHNTSPGTTTGQAPSNPTPAQSSPQGMNKQ